MNIDIESFRFIWEQIESKLEEISKIPKLFSPRGRGADFIGYEIDSSGITYRTETFNCGDTEPESFTIEWHEMNKPIEYFKEKYQKQIDVWRAERNETARKEKESEERQARKKYEELKKRFETPSLPDSYTVFDDGQIK